MARIYTSLLELVGKTPLIATDRLSKALGLQARLLVKLEAYNPLHSVKDRAALGMIEAAEGSGLLQPHATIIEATSGNTGIGIAFVGRLKGYRVLIVMPESMSLERRRILAALGAELILSPAKEGMQGALRIAQELLEQTPGAVSLGQFDNPANPAIHETTTAEEIWEDTAGAVDLLVAGVGTGGTLSGTAKRLKAHKPSLQAFAVQPASSPVLTGGTPQPHVLQGIGAGFLPSNYHPQHIDEVLSVRDEEAIRCARLLARQEGILAGFSGGAVLHAAIEVAQRPSSSGKTLVAILPDTGERYLTTDLFKA